MKDPADRRTLELPFGFTAEAIADAEAGMAWWNGLTETGRLEALEAAETATPAVAWSHFKRRGALREIDEAMRVLADVREAWAKHFG